MRPLTTCSARGLTHACKQVLHWLQANAVWVGDKFTDKVIPREFRLEGYGPAWCHGTTLLLLVVGPPGTLF